MKLYELSHFLTGFSIALSPRNGPFIWGICDYKKHIRPIAQLFFDELHLWLGLFKLDNEILKVAKNDRKWPFWSKIVIFKSF